MLAGFSVQQVHEALLTNTLDATLSVRDMATNVDIRRDAEKLRLVNT